MSTNKPGSAPDGSTQPDDTTTTKPDEVDLESGTDPDGTPVENPSG
jgi:hypothetical protein